MIDEAARQHLFERARSAVDDDDAARTLMSLLPWDVTELATKAQMETGFERLSAQLERIDARFEQVDARFEQVDARFEQVDARFDQVAARFEGIEGRLLLRVVFAFVAVNSTFIGAVATAQQMT